MIALVFWAIAAPVSNALADEVGARLPALLTCMRDNLSSAPREVELALHTQWRTGERQHLVVRVHTDGSARRAITVRVRAPEDLAGTAYLFERDDDGIQVHAWLPALGRVRRLVGAEGMMLMGTTLRLEDLEQIVSGFADASVSLGRPRIRDGRETERLVVMPSPSHHAQAGRLRVDVDRERCVVMEIERELDRRVVSRYTADSGRLRASGRGWYAEQAELHDLRSGGITDIQVLGESTVSASPSRFSRDGFFRD